MACRAWVGVVIVMPAFAAREDADQHVVAAVVRGLVIAVAPAMADRIDGPGSVPAIYDPERTAPHQDAKTQLDGFGEAPARQQSAAKSYGVKRRPRHQHDLEPVVAALEPSLERIAHHVLGVACNHTAGLHVGRSD